MLEVAEGCKDRNVVLCSLGSTSRLRDRTLADASGRKPTNPRPQSPGSLCRRGEFHPKYTRPLERRAGGSVAWPTSGLE